MKWIGMVHVRPLPGSSVLAQDAKGAYGSVVAVASSEYEYKHIITNFFAQDGLDVLEVTNLAPSTEYEKEGNLSDYLKYLVNCVSEVNPVQFHTFFNYYDDDA